MNSVKLKRQLIKERWIALIKESKESPLLLKDWLKENNVSKDQYYYWKRKLDDEYTSNIPNHFVEVPANVINDTELTTVSNESNITNVPSNLNANNNAVASIKTDAFSIDIYAGISPSMLKQLLEVAKYV